MATDQSERSGASDAAGAAKARTGKIVDDMQDRFREASEDVRHGAEKASDELRRGYERASQAARDGYVRVEKDIESMTRDLSGYIRENPGKSVILAAGAGFLLGLLMSSEED